jgi:hypothetical protein
MFFWPWHYLLAKLCNHLIEIRNMPKCTPGCTHEHTLMPGAWANMLLPGYMCDVLLMFSFICTRAYIHLLFAKFLHSFIKERIFVQYSLYMYAFVWTYKWLHKFDVRVYAKHFWICRCACCVLLHIHASKDFESQILAFFLKSDELMLAGFTSRTRKLCDFSYYYIFIYYKE